MQSLPDSMINVLTLLQVEPQWLVVIGDFYLKAALLLCIARYLDWDASPFLASAQKRLLWIATLVVLAILPLSSIVIAAQGSGLVAQANKTLWLVILPEKTTIESGIAEAQSISWWSVMLALYLCVLGLHMARLAVSFWQVRRLRSTTDYRVPAKVQAILAELCKVQGLGLHVQLGVNGAINSPLTFGVWKPVVVVPDRGYFATEDLLRNVLLHELSHIKRRDTLLFIVAHTLAALNWFNPFVWYALRRLDLESEYACDDDVLRSKSDKLGFATQLLEIARGRSKRRVAPVFQKAMAGQGQLSKRIDHVLNSMPSLTMKRNSQNGVKPVLILLLSAAVLGNCHIVAAGDEQTLRSEDVRLLRFYPPEYPAGAFDRRISGFAQYEFAVNAAGKVDMQSLKLLRTSHSDWFLETSEAALAKFEFVPRTINGRRVATERVRYTFNYQMRF